MPYFFSEHWAKYTGLTQGGSEVTDSLLVLMMQGMLYLIRAELCKFYGLLADYEVREGFQVDWVEEVYIQLHNRPGCIVEDWLKSVQGL